MTVQRMDPLGIVVDDLDAAVPIFGGLGMELGGGTTSDVYPCASVAGDAVPTESTP